VLYLGFDKDVTIRQWFVTYKALRQKIPDWTEPNDMLYRFMAARSSQSSTLGVPDTELLDRAKQIRADWKSTSIPQVFKAWYLPDTLWAQMFRAIGMNFAIFFFYSSSFIFQQ
jgi:hypothetical protein